MAYIGRGLDKISNVEKLDNLTFDGSSSYTLQKGGSSFIPSSANNILLSIDGVVQAGNFTVSGSTIDFGTAISGSSTCDFILHYGVGLITTPADGTVSLDKLSATGTKDATTFLRGDNTFASAGLSGWSEDGANNNLLPASASAGIYLGVNSATAANLLDDYEEGTWTPAFANAPSATFNANGQQGYYTKVGRLVTVGFNLSISSLGGGSGGADITGLPFAASNTPTSSRYMGTIGGDDNWSTDLSGNNTVLQIYGDYLNTRIFLQKNNCNNKADIQLSDIGTSRVLGTITYFA